TNWWNISAARSEGLTTYYGSLLSDQTDDRLRLGGLGKLLALTSNEEANALTAVKFTRIFGSGNVYQLIPHHQSGARGQLAEDVGGRKLFHGDATFHALRRLKDAGATLQETELGSDSENSAQPQIPLFLKEGDKI